MEIYYWPTSEKGLFNIALLTDKIIYRIERNYKIWIFPYLLDMVIYTSRN